MPLGFPAESAMTGTAEILAWGSVHWLVLQCPGPCLIMPLPARQVPKQGDVPPFTPFSFLTCCALIIDF